MKKTLITILCVILIITSLALVGCNDGDVDSSGNNWSDDFDLFGKVLEYVKANYIGDIDLDELDYITAYNLIRALDDFSYLTDDTVSFISTASLGLAVTHTKYNEYVVDYVYQGFPSAQTQSDGFTLMRGDHIWAINGERVEGASSTLFNRLNQGGVGTRLVLTISRNGVIMGDYTYEKVDKYIPKAYYVGDLDSEHNDVGYIKLTEFSEAKLSDGTKVSAVEDFDNCIASLKADGKTSLILDLRGNPGGSANILAHIASYFVPIEQSDGTLKAVDILSLKYEKSNEEYMVKVSENNYMDMPVTVLVDENTASAAEALTGAIRAYHRDSRVIGVKTYGKGVFQSRSPEIKDKTSTSYAFDDSYYIMLVSGYYYIVDPSVEGGRYCIHKNGITPDVTISTATKGRLLDDAEIQKAIELMSN